MVNKPRLTISIRTTGYTEALKSGEITVPGFDLEFIDIKPQVASFRRMVRGLEFHICEMASTTYLIARGYGKPFKALPTFFNRRFHHRGILVRPDSGIMTPKDLEGRKFGVRAYSVTTGVWTRGVLQNEYGVDPDKITWVVDDEEHVTELKLPANVERVPPGKSLASMMASGEIEVGMAGNAGLGREGAPREDWAANAVPSTDAYHELIPDYEEQEIAWYKRTGIYPCHPTIVIRDDIAAEYPELPRKLFDALVASKEIYLKKLYAGELEGKADKSLFKMHKIVGGDPLPYGLEVNRPAINTLMQYALQQHLIPRPLDLDETFYNLN